MKVKFWTCGNCGHEEPITDNDLQELNPVVSSTGAIKISCPNCGAYMISKPFNDDMEPLFTVLFNMITDGILEKAEV